LSKQRPSSYYKSHNDFSRAAPAYIVLSQLSTIQVKNSEISSSKILIEVMDFEKESQRNRIYRYIHYKILIFPSEPEEVIHLKRTSRNLFLGLKKICGSPIMYHATKVIHSKLETGKTSQ
jgi:hypothetical protein